MKNMNAFEEESIFDNGTGTQDDPYVITNLTQLEAVSDNPSSYFILDADITDPLESSLCSAISPFSGGFNGNNHTIAIKISETTTYSVGLFSRNAGTISNIKITGSTNGSSDNLGILVGSITGFNTGTITGCTTLSGFTVTGGVIGTAVTLGVSVGGITGYNTGTITGCTSFAAVSTNGGDAPTSAVGGLIGYNVGLVSNSSSQGTVVSIPVSGSAYTGGLVGYNSGASISNCFATGSVLANGSATTTELYVGGLIGNNNNGKDTDTVTNCYTTGNVSAGSLADGATYIGGLIGCNYEVQVSGCYATGTVKAAGSSEQQSRIGGLIGYNKFAPISGCYANGDVSGSGVIYAGGLVGQNYSKNTDESGSSVTDAAPIDNCHATGNVSLSSSTSTSTQYSCLGGLAGGNSTTNTASLAVETYNITNCYASGNITNAVGYSHTGGLLGFNQAISVQNCYACGDITTAGHSNSGGLIGFNRSEAKIQYCYAIGDINGTNITDSSTYLGGLIGNSYSGTYASCYASGTATGTNAIMGGYLGNLSAGTQNNIYWNSSKNEKSVGNRDASESSNFGTGLTTAQMTGTAAPTNMSGLDFAGYFIATPNKTKIWFYPQLIILFGSGDSTVHDASIKSVTETPQK